MAKDDNILTKVFRMNGYGNCNLGFALFNIIEYKPKQLLNQLINKK